MDKDDLSDEQRLLHDCTHALADTVFVLRGRQLPGASARMPDPAGLAKRAEKLIRRIKDCLDAKVPA